MNGHSSFCLCRECVGTLRERVSARADAGAPAVISGPAPSPAREPVVGTPVQATLWQVEYFYRPEAKALAAHAEHPDVKAGKERFKQMFMLGTLPEPKEDPSGMRTGSLFVLTADPSGSDLLQVAERACREAGTLGTDFSLVGVRRICDVVRGLALVAGGPS